MLFLAGADTGFPVGRGTNPLRGHQHTNLLDFPKYCMKLRKFWSMGGPHWGCPPLDPPLPWLRKEKGIENEQEDFEPFDFEHLFLRTMPSQPQRLCVARPGNKLFYPLQSVKYRQRKPNVDGEFSFLTPIVGWVPFSSETIRVTTTSYWKSGAFPCRSTSVATSVSLLRSFVQQN